MPDEIKVSVVEFGDRPYYMFQWRDPDTRKKKTKASDIPRDGKAKSRQAAEKAAGVLQDQLRAGVDVEPKRLTWAAFRDRYDRDVIPSLAEGTAHKIDSVFNTVERLLGMNDRRLKELDANTVARYATLLREAGRAESTIKAHLAHLQAALRWAADKGLLAVAPKIKHPKRARQQKMMKGRPITREEFERMLDKVVSVLAHVGPAKHPGRKPKRGALPEATLAKLHQEAARRAAAIAPAWKRYLEGLWWSGLRLTESLDLFWDAEPGKLSVDLTGKRPMLRIPAAADKGNQERILPIVPEFAQFLLQTHPEARTGRVFDLPARRTHGERMTADAVSRTVSAIGKAAGVKVNTDAKSGKVKFASAHDLRRSFGERWSFRVMPQQLMQLMRHESIETTMRFYVGRNAEAVAETLWAQFGNDSGNTPHNQPSAPSDESTQEACQQRLSD